MAVDKYAVQQWAKRKTPMRPIWKNKPPVVEQGQPQQYDLSGANTKGLQQFDPFSVTDVQQSQPPPAPPPEKEKKVFSAPDAAGSSSNAIGAGGIAQKKSALTTPGFAAPEDATPRTDGSVGKTKDLGGKPGVVPTPGATDEPTSDEAALRALLDEYEKGKPIEEWKKGQEQQAALGLANAEEEALARGGGTDNPYATLAGISAQGEYQKRLGDIEVKDVEWWFKRTQERQNLLTQLEQWNRENKPDLFAEWQPKISATFGQGSIVHGDSVMLADGTELRLEDMNPAQRETFAAYQAAMGLPPMEEATSPEEKKADRGSFEDKIVGTDPGLSNSTTAAKDAGEDYGEDEYHIMQKAWEYYEKTGESPTPRMLKGWYDDTDENYGDAEWSDWDDDDPRWDEPAF